MDKVHHEGEIAPKKAAYIDEFIIGLLLLPITQQIHTFETNLRSQISQFSTVVDFLMVTFSAMVWTIGSAELSDCTAQNISNQVLLKLSLM